MESLAGGSIIGYWLFYTILLLVAYHKIFTVYYFSLSHGLLRELGTAAFLGIILAWVSIYIWQIGVGVIVIIALMGVSKVESSAGKIVIIVLAVIASIVIIVSGRAIRKSEAANAENGNDSYTYEDDYDDDYEEYEADDYGYAYEDDTYDSYENDVAYAENEDYAYTNEEEWYEEDTLGFVFPNSDSTYLDGSELEGLSAEECRIGRNEIYARHGRIFQDDALRAYFEQFDWYEGIYDADEFDESVLNVYEIANRDLIIDYETEMGYR